MGRTPGEDLRRSFVLLQLLDEVVDEVLRAFARTRDDLTVYQLQQIRAALHHGLQGAFDAGAARESDLRSAIDIQNAEIRKLKAEIRAFIRRIAEIERGGGST